VPVQGAAAGRRLAARRVLTLGINKTLASHVTDTRFLQPSFVTAERQLV